MGTTVTTNLGLIKPDTAEHIEENLPTWVGWAAQNAINADKIDALFRATTTTGVMNWTAGAGNPTLGSGGFVEVKYLRMFPRMVFGYFRLFTGGAGFAAGTGAYRLSTPTTVASELGTFNDSCPVGKAVMLSSGNVALSTNAEVMYDVVLGQFVLRNATGGVWAQTNPFTLAQNDRVSGYFSYPTSAA